MRYVVKMVKVKMVKMRSESGSSVHYNNKYIYIYYYSGILTSRKTILTKMTMTVVTTPPQNFSFFRKKVVK